MSRCVPVHPLVCQSCNSSMTVRERVAYGHRCEDCFSTCWIYLGNNRDHRSIVRARLAVDVYDSLQCGKRKKRER